MEIESNFCPISARPDEPWEGPILRTRWQKVGAVLALVLFLASAAVTVL